MTHQNGMETRNSTPHTVLWARPIPPQSYMRTAIPSPVQTLTSSSSLLSTVKDQPVWNPSSACSSWSSSASETALRHPQSCPNLNFFVILTVHCKRSIGVESVVCLLVLIIISLCKKVVWPKNTVKDPFQTGTRAHQGSMAESPRWSFPLPLSSLSYVIVSSKTLDSLTLLFVY